MNTLKKLKLGQLVGNKELKLACGLKEFPREIFTLAETLEVLDMTDNNLSTLPDDFGKLKNLRILFLSNNQFSTIPMVLSEFSKLSMIGFRNNQISTLAENTLPLSTRWLILTDNELIKLPNSMGNLKLLQKCMLSGNKLTCLPQSMHKCHNSELLRIAVNKFQELPSFLLHLPKLSWLAYGANPFCNKYPARKIALKEFTWNDLELKEILGEGASGIIVKAIVDTKEVAIKIFKGDISSDGLPKEEMDINIAMGHHKHLVNVLARVVGHPQDKDVLMLELIPSSYFNLGLPPTLKTCTRDVFPKDFTLTLDQSNKILLAMANAIMHMHERGIMHGDFYAHNIMIDTEANAILGDFGAASYYKPKETEVIHALERLEVRAFGCLIEELLLASKGDTTDEKKRKKLTRLKKQCLQSVTHKRPLFSIIYEELL